MNLDPAGVAVFFAVVLGVLAASFASVGQWGIRRITFGVAICSGAIAGILLSEALWWAGLCFWGLHQIRIGWSYVSRRRRTGREHYEYLRSSASVLAYIALADGDISSGEIALIRDTYGRAGFDAKDVEEVEAVVRECQAKFRADGSDYQRVFLWLRQACAQVGQHSNQHTRLSFFRTAVLLAAVDGFVSSGEDGALRAAAGWLLISDEDVDRVWRSVVGADSEDTRQTEERTSDSSENRDDHGGQEEPTVPPDLATYYARILGVSVTASPTELKSAYRARAKHYHPDVVMHKGPAFSREAEERFKEVSRAYEFLRGGRAATG